MCLKIIMSYPFTASPFLKEFTFPGKPPTAFPTELVFLLLSVVYCSPLGSFLTIVYASLLFRICYSGSCLLGI